MDRYFINIMHDGIIIPRIMLDAKSLNEAKTCAIKTMLEHGFSQSTIEDVNYNKLSEFRCGKWTDKFTRMDFDTISKAHDIGEAILKLQLSVSPCPELSDSMVINMENGTTIKIAIERSVRV